MWEMGDRNPVKYVDIESLGIDPAKLNWRPMPNAGAAAVSPPQTPTMTDGHLTIAEAKKRLAATFGVSTDAVEITIRA